MPAPRRRAGESLKDFKERAFRHFHKHHPEWKDEQKAAAALSTVRRYGKQKRKGK